MTQPQPSQKAMNLLFSTWLHPKQSTRDVVHHKSMGYVLFIMTFGYMGSTTVGFIDSNFYPGIPLWGIIMLLFALSPIIAILSNAIYAAMIWFTGKLFKGSATYKEVFKSFSLITIPYIVFIPIILIWMFVDPISLFDATNSGNYNFLIFTSIIVVITSIWSFVINIAVIAEVEQISNWKAFFTIFISTAILSFLAFIVILIILLVIFVIVGYFPFLI